MPPLSHIRKPLSCSTLSLEEYTITWAWDERFSPDPRYLTEDSLSLRAASSLGIIELPGSAERTCEADDNFWRMTRKF